METDDSITSLDSSSSSGDEMPFVNPLEPHQFEPDASSSDSSSLTSDHEVEENAENRRLQQNDW